MKHNPRIIMFAPYCYPPVGSEAIVTSKLVYAMLKAGWGVDVVTQANVVEYYPFSTNRGHIFIFQFFRSRDE
jgi:hypothetical protein